ncbi:hypothetical protein MANES_07G010600v8 [Manihot esculenta]|uniref:Uncharacterized protein n=1 Tax=Manihot esculenta TaxID=3983 RepID=A0ACB7HCL9_MANES|nr:hypothetical protein MANES_07G010600v8 [Manihot esculenta]
MAVTQPGLEKESELTEKEEEVERKNEGNEGKKEPKGERDLEKGEISFKQKVMESNNVNDEDQRNYQESMLQRLNPSNPLRIVINSSTRVATASPSQTSLPLSAPTPQPSIATLNSRRYTNKISLFLFVLHMVLVFGLVCFLVFKGIQGLLAASDSVKRKEKRILKYFLPQVEVASLLSIALALAWQKAIRVWPRFMVHFILWCSFFLSLSAGILLICFQKAPTDGVGICLIVFAIGNGLYACWVYQKIKFSTKVLIKSLESVRKFGDLNHPTYWVLGVGFLWMSMWILALIGALNFYFPPLTIIALVLSLAWTAEVMRNVVNLTVSRVISLYYLRGMQANTKFCFQRAVTRNLGSACLGSLFVPAIEALRIVARALNLLEGEDEFMFSCAHCCLGTIESIFRHGNGWAFVQIAAYGKCFVQASQDTWALFQRQDMTRIAMALPHACVSCYYVCYAENPENRLFDKTIKDHQNLTKS